MVVVLITKIDIELCFQVRGRRIKTKIFFFPFLKIVLVVHSMVSVWRYFSKFILMLNRINNSRWISSNELKTFQEIATSVHLQSSVQFLSSDTSGDSYAMQEGNHESLFVNRLNQLKIFGKITWCVWNDVSSWLDERKYTFSCRSFLLENL